MTSTPLEQRAPPQEPRASPHQSRASTPTHRIVTSSHRMGTPSHRMGTPTHFITPKSMNGSAEQRHQRMMQQQSNTLLRPPIQSSQKRDFLISGPQKPGQDKRFTTPAPNYGRNLLPDTVKRTQNGLFRMEPPSKMKRTFNATTPSPALMSYKNLMLGRTGSSVYPGGRLSSGLSNFASSSSFQTRQTPRSNFPVNITSHIRIPRKD